VPKPSSSSTLGGGNSQAHGWKNTLSTGLSLAALTAGLYGVNLGLRALESQRDASLSVVPITEVLRQAQEQIDSGAHVVRSIEAYDLHGVKGNISLSEIRVSGFVPGEGKVIDGAFSNSLRVGTWKFSGDHFFTKENSATLVIRGAELRRISTSMEGQTQGPQKVEIIPVSIFPSAEGGLTIFAMDVVAR
jgi:hypothetical protein